jgi:uncharacterized protein YjeT (DUF2065 family)
LGSGLSDQAGDVFLGDAQLLGPTLTVSLELLQASQGEVALRRLVGELVCRLAFSLRLFGLSMFIIGMIIKYAPEDDRDRKRKHSK